MRENMRSAAAEYTKRNHWQKIWKRVAGVLACIVVFCTTYALILPALTMESETVCGLEEHTHSAECYRQVTSEQVRVLNCKLEVHSHGDECYDAEGKLLCGQAAYVLHEHSEICFADGELVCQLPEVKEHRHGDSCRETKIAEPVLVCKEMDEAHVHGEDCYEVPLACTIPESEAHTHDDGCYQTENVLICTEPEIVAHSHSAECEGGCDLTEVAAHTHGEDCFETQESPVDTEELTCQLPVGEDHAHGAMCYGTWVLECKLPEHTHTEECEPDQELTEEELAQVEAVIAQIDALETTEQVEAKLAEYEAAEDFEGYETYREEAAQKTQTVRDSYNALSDAQKQKVTNAAKLTQLDWLVPAATLEEEENTNKGEIKLWLDGDYAYIKSLKVVSRTTGTEDWDADDKPGNDSSADNDILRTFDVMTYTLEFETKLRDAKAQEDVGGYNAGRVYFEFILPASRSEAQFETDSMGFLQTAENIQKEIVYDVNINGVPCQVLRGSYTLTAAEGNAAIGASTSQLGVTIRALRMQNGDKIKPTFTMWLQHNNVGATYDPTDDRLPTTIVTGQNITCETTDTNEEGETVPHGTEAVTCEGAEVTISARTMLNIAVVGNNAHNVSIGTYNFGTADAPVNLEGRLIGVGLRIELRGKPGQKMRGVEFPDPNSELSFELDISSTYTPAGKSVEDVPNYQVQFWTGGGNYLDDDAAVSTDTEISGSYNQTDRQVKGLVGSDRIAELPANWKLDGNYFYNSCYDGGAWKFTPVDGKVGKFIVTVSNFTVMPEVKQDEETDESIDVTELQKTGYFPDTYVSGNQNNPIYYDPDDINNYWELPYAVFSAGELWLAQPHQGLPGTTDAETHITAKHADDPAVGSQGQFNTHVEVSETMNVSWETDLVTQVEPDGDKAADNQKNWDLYLKSPGTVDGRVVMLKDESRVWNEALTDGCYDTDADWATTGSGVTLTSYVAHDKAEGDFVGVAYNDLLKFDDEFFAPDTDQYNATMYGNAKDGMQYKILWAALPDGGGWDDDEHMKRATPDDLVFYNSVNDLIADGKTPVGAMLETRGVCKEADINHFLQFVDGTIKGEPGQVYMITRCSYAWRKKDVAQAALNFHNEKYKNDPTKKQYTSVSQLSDDDYNEYLQEPQNGFPSRQAYVNQIDNTIEYHNDIDDVTGTGADRLFSSANPLQLAANSRYPQPFWRQDYNYAQRSGTLQGNGGQTETTTSVLRQCYKASYENGVYKAGYGIHFYQDSCLVVPFKTQITKSTAQIESSTGNAKQVYDMSQNQRTVVYKLTPSVVREGGGSVLNTTVYIEDILPAGLTYEHDTSYLGGTCDGSTGAVTGGTQITPTITKNEADGTTTLRWWFDVSLDTETTYWSQPIYYSCTIGDPGSQNDVVHDQQLSNSVKIWATGSDTSTSADDDDCRPFSAMHGNLDTYSILIQKTSAVSLAKISDYLVVDKGEPFGFTMTVGNNSGEAKKNTVIMESLPINGLNRTHFNGRLVVSEFAAELVNAGEAKLADKLNFYYTTSEDFAGKLSSDILAMAKEDGKTVTDWLALQVEAEIWKSLTFDTSADNKLPSVTEQEGWNTYEPGVDKEYEQITAILAVGELPANATLKMHITIQLPDGDAKDYMVNYLSQDESLTSYARAQMVNRTLQGLTWLDADRDGYRDSGENMIYGVKVSLLQQNGTPVYYTNNPDMPVVIQTGQTTSVLTGETKDLLDDNSEVLIEHEDWNYQFTDLPAGTYAVEFTSGSEEESITYLVASPVDNAGDDAKDSDGVPTYSSDKKRLEKTRIEGIEMPEAHKLTYGEHVSRYHDSGFYYRDVELPSTGGMGPLLFYVIGGSLALTAGAALCQKKRREKDSSES